MASFLISLLLLSGGGGKDGKAILCDWEYQGDTWYLNDVPFGTAPTEDSRIDLDDDVTKDTLTNVVRCVWIEI